MASSKQQILSTYGAFYLPLAVLTGLTLSVILPAALGFLIPTMGSALFISLPHLWDAFLSWVTPPCLFVLLNGIIVVLTASSGVFSTSESVPGSEFYANVLGKMENSQTASSGALIADSSASDSYTNLLPKMEDVQKQSSAAVMVDAHLPQVARHTRPTALSHTRPTALMADTHLPQVVHHTRSAAIRGETHLPTSSQAMLCRRTPPVFHDAHGVLEAEQIKIFDKEGGGDHKNRSNLSRLAMESRSFSHARSKSRIWEEEEEQEDENSSNLSRLAMESRSFSYARSKSRISEEEEEDDEDIDERLSGLPKLAVVNKSFSFGSRSEPSSPQFVAPNMIKRSLSVDSASFNDNQASSSSPEDLSDEAFRKRIEDFISKKKTQLRSEAN